jgi:hypothetical protein
MTKELVETAEVIGDLSKLEQELSQAVSSRNDTGKKPEVKQTQQVEDDQLPVKLRGKSAQEIAAMYVNLESSYGRMANDLGTQRKLTDRLLDLKRENDLQQNAPQKVEIKSEELLDNPTAALERFSAARESQRDGRLNELEARLAATAFVSAHPDYATYQNDTDFAAWIQASPIRARAAASAANGDWSTASDLLTEYKSVKGSTKKVDDEGDNAEDAARKAAAKASLESSSQNNQKGKTGKVYRRADLMRLRAEKPDVYFSSDFQSEIIRAYADGRVK